MQYDGKVQNNLVENNNNLVENNSISDSDVEKKKQDNLIFPLGTNDTIFVLTINNSNYKNNVGNLVSKMIIIKELRYVSLDNFSLRLANIGIKELDIFSIHNKSDGPSHSLAYSNKGCSINYIEVKSDTFMKLINHEKDFRDYNKHSLYIVRGGNYIDIKNLFATVNNREVNLGRGGSQKAHMLSPLDFRLSCYMMAMTGFDHNVVNNLNTFNYVNKDRYLSWMDKSSYLSKIRKCKHKDKTIFKPIYVNKMPLYYEDISLEYCMKCTC